MLKLCRVTKVNLLVLLNVFNFDLFEFSAAILEKGLLRIKEWVPGLVYTLSVGHVLQPKI